MPLRLAVDVEALVLAYLRSSSSVTALAGQRVYTRLPSSPSWPLVTVLLVTGREIIRTHLDEQQIQVDCWGPEGVAGKDDANLLARTVRAVLLEAPTVSHARGVVTHVRTIVPPRWSPDPDTDRPRYIGEYGIFLHPNAL